MEPFYLDIVLSKTGAGPEKSELRTYAFSGLSSRVTTYDNAVNNTQKIPSAPRQKNFASFFLSFRVMRHYAALSFPD